MLLFLVRLPNQTRNERTTGGSPGPYSPFLAAKVFVANGRKEDRRDGMNVSQLLGETLNSQAD